jgi:hypothetical protein
MPDDHDQAADDDTADDDTAADDKAADDTAAYHCAPDHDERVRVAAAPHGRPHARNNDRAGDDVSGAAGDDDYTASDHIGAGDDGAAPGYDDGHGPGPRHDDAATRDYRRTGDHASP